MDKKLDDDWIEFKRKSLRFGSILGWAVGAIFSYIGFTSGSKDGLFWRFLGVALTALVTILELWMNSTKMEDLIDGKSTFGDLLLFVGGCLSYVYDAWTNFLGLCVLMLGVSHVIVSQLSWSDMITPALGGILLAALPEPMFVASRKKYQPVLRPAFQPLQQQKPNNTVSSSNKPNQNNHKPKQTQMYHPQAAFTNSNTKKLVSPIFNQRYTDRYKK